MAIRNVTRKRREHEHTKERGVIDRRFVIWKHEVYIDATFGQVIWTTRSREILISGLYAAQT
jgi:hypothetical protein